MASFAAVICLKQTIRRIQTKSSLYHVYDTTGLALESAYEELESLQQVLETLDERGSSSSRSSERVRVLEGRIRDAAHKLEDELEILFSDQTLLRRNGPSDPPMYYYIIDEDNLTLDTNPLAEMKKEYMDELSNPTLTDKERIAVDSGGDKSEMVGFDVEYNKLKEHMVDGEMSSYKIFSLVGMGGIGKTTLAERIFKDPAISSFFECRAWVTVGPERQLEETVQCILDQLSHPDSNEVLKIGNGELLLKFITRKRYFIVVDDIWDHQLWDELQKSLPRFRNGSRVLITTRLQQVSKHVSTGRIWAEGAEIGYGYHQIHQIHIPLLDEKQSWCLFCRKVFGEELCPTKLEKVGKKIAEKCAGLPLTIVTVAALLSKGDKTDLLSDGDKIVKFWSKVAEDREHPVFTEAYDRISKVLISSYNHLPQQLKPWFLYVGAFPQNYVISTSKLIDLCDAEGFVESIWHFAMICLKKLVSNNLLMVHQHSYDDKIKTCTLHSAFWQLCIRVARENKFLHVLNSYDDGLAESIKGQRRLCVQNNVLFAIKDVHDSMESISAAHSLLCNGPYHQYPVPVCSGLRLLRVLDALTLRFYEFPMEVLNLAVLRYLALTCNGKIPASISKLWNLRFLILRQHMSIRSPEDSAYLPVTIWDLRELEHLQIMGSDLPDPNGGNILYNLKSLLDVSPRSCTKEVFGNFWVLQKLGIRIKLRHDTAEVLSCFDNLSLLGNLNSLKCVIVNPLVMHEVVTPPLALFSNLPSRLKKLSLSGFGYGWKNMSKIASLPNLKVLKLRSYAFRGPEWITGGGEIQRLGYLQGIGEFHNLEYLLIEDTDLVHWRGDDWCFPSLKRLTISHCYKLKVIPQLSRSSKLEMIQIVDSNPSVVAWAKQEQEKIKYRIERSNVRDHFVDLDSILKVKEMWSD